MIIRFFARRISNVTNYLVRYLVFDTCPPKEDSTLII